MSTSVTEVTVTHIKGNFVGPGESRVNTWTGDKLTKTKTKIKFSYTQNILVIKLKLKWNTEVNQTKNNLTILLFLVN